MSDDLFSSSKGPGLIGLLLGLIVLAGFCGLGLAVFDDRFNGDHSNRRQTELKKNAAEIVRLQEQIEYLQEQKKLMVPYRKVQRDLKEQQDRRSQLASEATTEEAGLEKIRTDWNEYKAQYRTVAKARLVGRVIDQLTTADGRSFTSVKITGVSAHEMTFQHRDGAAKVKLAHLPDDLQDELQYEKDEIEELPLPEKPGDARRRLELQARIRDLNFQIQKTRGYIERVARTIPKYEGTIALNKKKVEEYNAEALAESEKAQQDKMAGAPARRAEERAQAAQRKALALQLRNRDLDNKIDELRLDIKTQEGKISAAQREIQELQAEISRLAAEEPGR